jgi:8-oxo-dGDP phosphatase
VSSQGFTTLAVEEHYRGRSTVRVERVRTPEGEEVDREIVGHDDAVAVVPVTDDGEVVLLRQYRQALREHLLEIPAGTLDVAGESPLEAARRELAEETGYTARRLEHLASFDNSAGWTDERTHVYLATGLTDGGRPDGFQLEHEEADMEIVHLELEQAIEDARAGRLTDAKTLVGLLLTAGRVESTARVEPPGR